MQSEPGGLAALPVRRHVWRGYFLIAAATLCWAGAATFGKAVFKGRLFGGQSLISPLVLTQTRTTFAAGMLTLFLALRVGTNAFKLCKRDLLLCALIGTLGLAGSNFFYYWAIQKTTVAVAITVQYTAPVWVLIFMVARGRQAATVSKVIAVLLALAGVALVAELFSSETKLNAAGVGAAMLAAFSFSFYNIGAQELVARNNPLQIMNYALLSSAALWFVVDPPWRLAAKHYTGGQWGFLFAFACLSMLLPYVLYFHGLKYLDPTRAVVTSCLEPVFATLFAALFIGEKVHGMQAIGIAAVLIATIMVQRKAATTGLN
ncbi:MAG TPA: EamA family transporter [Candidatus Angelobacter sp.]|nr:EamA family transporter [Candidatus Angelobacter sp.]